MSEGGTSNLWLMFEVLARRRGLILGVVIVVTLVAAAVSFVLPKWYRAEAVLLPPKDVSMPIGSLARLAEVVSVTEGLNLPVMVTPSDLYARMLSSRTIQDRIIGRFDLKQRYNTENMIETRMELGAHVDIMVMPEGLVKVSVEDREPQMAAELANAFVEELDRLNKDIVTQRTRQTRSFIEARLEQVQNELEAARSAFEQFQRDNRALDFDQQTRLAIDQAAQLKVSLAEVQLDIEMTEHVLSSDNPQLVQLKQKQAILQRQLNELESGGRDSSYFALPVSSIPELRGQYEDLYARVRVNESLFRLLLEELEQAKIQESESAPSISVLDEALPPELRSRPQRTIIVGISFLLACLAALFLAAFLEYLGRLQRERPEDYNRAAALIVAYLGWLPGIKKNLRRTG
jgi:uncharacterized protein involved in exopolysaccharide biosynthesis